MDTHDQLCQHPTVQPLMEVKNKKKLKTGNEKDARSYNKMNMNNFNHFICKIKSRHTNGNKICFYFNTLVVIFSLTASIVLFRTKWFENSIENLIVLSNGSYIYNLWRDTPINIIHTIYIFNYTNPKEVLAGREKPKLQELGPYVFRQTMTRWNVELNETDKVTFSENIVSVFDEEASNGTMDEKCYIPNFFVMAAISLARKYNKYTQLLISTTLNSYPAFFNTTVREFLFDFDDKFSIIKDLGYVLHQDTVISLGLLKQRDGLIDDRITIGTGVPDLNKLGIIQEYNGHREMNEWNETSCNRFNEASDGTFFPRNLIISKKPLFIYRRLLCRAFPFVFNGTGYSPSDYPVNKYVLAPDAFKYGDNYTHNRCFCQEYCPTDGVFDFSPCLYDLPFFFSEPHFLNADKSLLESIDGLNPDPEKHAGHIDVHNLGLTLTLDLKIQPGIILKNSPYFSHYKKVKFGQVFPLGWINVKSSNLTETVDRLIYHLNYTVPLVKIVMQWSFLAIFLVFLMHLIVRYLFRI